MIKIMQILAHYMHCINCPLFLLRNMVIQIQTYAIIFYKGTIRKIENSYHVYIEMRIPLWYKKLK